MAAIVRKGDMTDHGGVVIGGSGKWTCMGQPIARKGDITMCPRHPGPQPIVQGSSKFTCENMDIARTGDKTACGASLISGQSKWTCD